MVRRKTPKPDRGASIRRLLRVIGLLLTGEHTIVELAAAVDRDVRTVERDIRALRDVGIGVTYERGAGRVAGRYSLDAEGLIDSLLTLSA